MARKLVAHRYADEAKTIIYNDQKLGDEVYNRCYPPALLTHMDAVREAYPLAFYSSGYLRVNASGFDVNLGGLFQSKWVSVEQPKTRKGFLIVRDYQRHDITDEKLAERIKEHAIQKHSFEDVCEKAYYEALSVLNTMTTGKKLAEAWPEAMEVIGDLIPEGSRTLPVVQVSAINAKFGLPPKTKKEQK
jgi:hypothetical protein